MEYHLNKHEKETIILYNQSNDRVGIATYDPSLRHRLAEYAAMHPGLCRRTDAGKYSDYAKYEIDKDRFSIRLIAPYSEERRKAAADLIQQFNHQTAKAKSID